MAGASRNPKTEFFGLFLEVRWEFNIIFYQFLQKLAASLTPTFFNFLPALRQCVKYQFNTSIEKQHTRTIQCCAKRSCLPRRDQIVGFAPPLRAGTRDREEGPSCEHSP